MSSVDERIVEMRFDNQQFESGVSTSLRTLDKLKASLTGLGGSANNLSELQTQADNFDMSGISAGVDKITDRFSTFGIMADQVVRRVTNALINLGARGVNAVKGLTIEPISTGFSQYEKETKSVQTLMNATGLSMEEVERYTKKLGFYVDETSYSYESMFSTLASMMSSGVEDVDTGVAALIGLGNAAGLAGVDAAQATHAFEGFGKAIGQGYMDSRNWSWIKTARMDTTALKQAFIDAGVAEGTLVQEKDNKTGEMLTYIADAAGKAKTKLGAINAANMDTFFGEHWLSRDVMLKGVGNYSTAFEQIYDEYLKTGDTVEEIIERMGVDLDEYSLKAFRAANQTRTFSDVVEYISGAVARRWSNAFKKIFGNFEESSALWASLIDPMYDMFITPLDDLNDTLDEWRKLGGYEDLSSGITESFESFASVVETIRSTFHDIFPATTAERLLEISKGFKEFTSNFSSFVEVTEDEDGNLVAVNETFGKLITGFKGGLSAISLVGRAFKTFFSSLSPTKELLKEFSSKTIDSFAKMGQFFIDLNNSEKVTEFFSKASEKLVDIQTRLANAIRKVNSGLATFIADIKDDVIDGFKGIGAGFSIVWEGIKAFAKAFQPIFDLFKPLGSSIGGFLRSLGTSFASAFGSIGRFLTALNECGSASEKFAKIQETVSNVVGKFTEKITTIKDSVRDFFKNLKLFDNKNFGSIFKNIFKDFDINTLTTMLTGLVTALAGVNFYRLFDLWKSRTVDFISTITDALNGIVDMFGSLDDVLYAMGQKKSSKILKEVAISIAILAGSLLLLGSIKPEVLSQGLMAIASLMGMLFGIMALFTKNDIFSQFKDKGINSIMAAANILMMAISVGILASAVKKLGNLDTQSILGGLTAIIALMAAMTQMSIIMSKKAGSAVVGASTMLAMASAILILSFAVQKIANINSGFGKGLIGTIALLGSLAAAGILMSKYGGQMAVSAVGMLGMATAVLIMSKAVAKLSAIPDPNAIGNSVLAIMGLLTTLAAFSSFSGGGKHALAAGTSLLVASVAISIMASAISKLSAINGDSMTNAVVAISGIMAVFGALSNFGGQSSQMLSAGASLLIASVAIGIIGNTLSKLSSIPFLSLAGGVVAMAGALTAIGYAMNLMVASISGSASLIVAAVGITILAGALAILSSINFLSLVGALIGLGGALAIIGAAAMVFDSIAIPILIFAGLLTLLGVSIGIAAAGILVLAAAFSALSAINFLSFLGAILAFGAAIAMLAVASVVVTLLFGPLLALGAILLVVSAAIALAGAGFMMLGAGFASLAVSAAAGAAGIVAAISILVGGIGAMGASLVGAVAVIVSSIAIGLTASIPAIFVAALAIITAIAAAISAAVPAVVSAILSLISGILGALGAYTPTIVSAAGQLVVGLIDGIASQIGPLLSAGQNLIISFVNGLAMSLNENGPKLIAAMGNVVAALRNTVISGLQAMVAGIPVIGDDLSAALEGLKAELDTSIMDTDLSSSGQTIGESVASGAEASASNMESIGQQAGQSFASGVESTSGDATEAGANLSTSISDGILEGFANIDASGAGSDLSSSALEGLVGNLGDFSAGGEDMSLEYINGLLNNEGGAQDAGNQLSTSGVAGADSTVGEWEGSGGNLALGLIKGILSKISDAKSAGAQLSTSAKEGADGAVAISSPSKAMIESGGYFGEGWIIGIKSMLTKAYRAGENLGGTSVNGISSAISDMSDLIENGIDTAPTITPVLDLSEVEAGMTRLRSMTEYSMNIGVPVGAVMPTEQSAISDKKIEEFLSLGRSILREIQNGSDLYFDDGVLAGRINRRLGTL